MTKIFNTLVELQKQAYVPYSHYPVACVLVDDKDNQHYGVNVENASYGLTICAERNAITTAVTKGVHHFKEAHIICGDNLVAFGTPCGACRQTMVEFMDDEDLIFIWNAKGEHQKYKVIDLLPKCFRKSYME